MTETQTRSVSLKGWKPAEFPRAVRGAQEGMQQGGRSPAPCQVEPQRRPKDGAVWRGAV
jgi:hypothetical protein